MTDEKKALSIPTQAALPAFLQEEDADYGMTRMGSYIRPPRIKVIQGQATEQYAKFDKGETILTPQLIKLAGFDKATQKGDVWQCVPLFFYPEWCLWNPIELKGQEPSVIARSLDPTSELAELSQSPDTWSRPHPSGGKDQNGNPLLQRYVEHLNFIVAPLIPGFEKLQFALSFFRAEMRSGVNWCSLLKMRAAPMCGQVFDMQVGFRKNAKGQWYGIDAGIPESEEEMFVRNETQYKAYKKAHDALEAAFNENRIVVDHGDDDEPAEGSSAANETEF